MSCIRAIFDGIYSGMYATYGYLMFQRKKCFILNWETPELRINHKKKHADEPRLNATWSNQIYQIHQINQPSLWKKKNSLLKISKASVKLQFTTNFKAFLVNKTFSVGIKWEHWPEMS